MTGHEIRKAFLDYFARHGHRIVKSSPLLPQNDPTLLFANAGMNQFKDVFLGVEKRDYRRATTSQKCVRAGGKHNDLEEVGRTARHHTFFEMLGNFSFGDYFKEDAIRFAWDLLVNEFKMDPARLWFTVFAGDEEVGADEEAVALWVKAGAPPERVARFGRKDNFWQMGETGPCGPCSEIHYYLGDNPDDPNFNRAEYVNGPGDETVEIWNLVFMQYNRQELEPGRYKLEPLPAPSVDTGAGLERVTAVLQGKKTNYETDLIRPIIDFIARLAGKEYAYESEDGVSMRVLADHARATTFLISDGVFPGNDGRAYVLRKIMRRALWHGRKLELGAPFFAKICDRVIDEMKSAYPELLDTRATIERVVNVEESLFDSTLSFGLKKFEEIVRATENRSSDRVIDGKDAFFLSDTFGMRDDLIEYIAAQRGFTVDWDGFQRELAGQRARARESWKGAKGAGAGQDAAYLEGLRSAFEGYSALVVRDAKVIALFRDRQRVPELNEGETGELVLDRTPYYAQSGGQVGDKGVIESEQGRAVVEDTQSPVSGVSVHKVKVEQGTLRKGETVLAQVDAELRRRTMANHSATHLLHAALKEVLGPHVKQAGSLVAPDRLRFDFTHFAALTPDEILEIERLVNDQVVRNHPVEKREMDLDQAIESGAVALFGEKYSGKVRVVTVPGFSKELCGGTHVSATGDIGVFKIVSDSSIASGTRRIEAVTHLNALERFQQDEALLSRLSLALNVTPEQAPDFVAKLQAQLRGAQREIERLKLKLASGGIPPCGTAEIQQVRGVKVLTRRVEDLDKANLRTLADNLLQSQAKEGVVILATVSDGKPSLVVRVAPGLIHKLPAGKIVQGLNGITGGRGGGKPELAEAGGGDPAKLDEALESAARIVEALM